MKITTWLRGQAFSRMSSVSPCPGGNGAACGRIKCGQQWSSTEVEHTERLARRPHNESLHVFSPCSCEDEATICWIDGFLAPARDRRSNLYSRQPRRMLLGSPLRTSGRRARWQIRSFECGVATNRLRICDPGGDRFWSIHLEKPLRIYNISQEIETCRQQRLKRPIRRFAIL
jgi:hypothetical protein